MTYTESLSAIGAAADAEVAALSKKFLADTTPSTRLAKVAELARAIIDAQTSEIADMRRWLKAAGYDSSGSGQGGGM